MIIVCTNNSPSVLELFLSSLRKFSREKHKVLVVETSDSTISQNVAKEYGALFTNSQLKYEIGAFNHAIKLFPKESEYFMLQDSVEFLNYDWEEMFRIPSKNDKLVGLCTYKLSEDPCYGAGRVFFENTFNKSFPVNESYGVMTNSFYISQIAKEKLIEFGIDKIVAENKNDTYDSERLIGAIAYYSCGIASTSEVVGNWIWDETHFRPNVGFTKFIYKNILKRN